MMPLFRVWVPSWGEDSESGACFAAHDESEAAELRAERCYEGNDHFDAIEVMVQPVGSSSVRAFGVHTEFDVQFCAYEATSSVEETAPSRDAWWHCKFCGDHGPADEPYAVGDKEPCATCGRGTSHVMTTEQAACFESEIARGLRKPESSYREPVDAPKETPCSFCLDNGDPCACSDGKP